MSPLIVLPLLLAGGALMLQLLIPRIGEARIARRLTERGGHASVRLSAFPALLLLWERGDRIEVNGSELVIGMSKQGGGLSALDGFRHVEITLHEFSTGPFDVRSFHLVRDGSDAYVMTAEAETSAATLADYGVERLGIGGAPLLGMLAKQAPLGGRTVPVRVEVQLVSEDGLLSVASGGGTIAGYPAGPIASMLAAAVARRLEITY